MTTPLHPAATAATTHHEELRRELIGRTEAVIRAVAAGAPHEFAQRRLVDFLHAELLPHAEAEDELLTAAAAGTEPTTLLARAMRDEHFLLTTLAGIVERASDPLDAAIAAGSLADLFDVCALVADRHLFPALAAGGVMPRARLRATPEIAGDTEEG